MDVDLDSLEVLEAVVEEGTFAKAARRLHRTQSAVSYGISKLEESLGVELFDRSGHRAVLTEAGRVVLDEGRGVLMRARRLEALAMRLGGGWEAKLDVIIDGILPLTSLLSVLQEFVEETIPTRVQVKMEYLGGVQYRFEEDDADIMVVKDYEQADNLRGLALEPVEVVLLASRVHPLAKIEQDKPVDRQDLQEFVELTVQDSSPSARRDPHVFGGSRVFYFSDFYSKKAAIKAGLGFGWMPRPLVEREMGSGELVEISYLEGSRYEFTPFLVHRVDRPLGKAGQLFLEVVRSRFAGEKERGEEVDWHKTK